MSPPQDASSSGRDIDAAYVIKSKSSQQGKEVTSEQSGNKVESRKDPLSVLGVTDTVLDEDKPPPLPARPHDLAKPIQTGHLSPSSLRLPKTSRPKLQSLATTAVSLTDIHTQSYQDGSRETYAAQAKPKSSSQLWKSFGSIRGFKGNGGSVADTASVRSLAPTLGAGADVESLLGNVLGASQEIPNRTELSYQTENLDPFDSCVYESNDELSSFDKEFDELDESSVDDGAEEQLLNLWKAKRKHFLILSSAGKPIYNRHGDDNLISGYIGVIQTIISFYEGAQDRLKGFTAADSRFVIMSQGPLYLVAISKLGESDAQLGVQLEALYMQILSTLTSPVLGQLFSIRPSTDLRRPLQGTESLLSALADSFTRGSCSTLLSALECLRIRKSHRQIINHTLLHKRCESLLYGLIVAGGRLVSVVRPRRHSLHPGDLQLIFNMLFEADSVKAGGGENWIPLCLPGFNRNGYLYMYVSFIQSKVPDGAETGRTRDGSGRKDEVAVLLISANKDSFYEIRNMRDAVVEELEKNGSLPIVTSAVARGRPTATDIIPGTVLRHFLYKSKANVQFVMPSYDPYFSTLVARRRLLSLYHSLHASIHAKNAHLKVHHCVSREATSLAWVTPLFEMYCVAGSSTSRNALAQSANQIVQWARREEERIFIIGGAVSPPT